MQCAMGAASAATAATGARAWLATRAWTWLTPRWMHRMTVALVGGDLVASAVLVSGPG